MKRNLLCVILAITMAFSSLTVSYARYTSENNTYTYRSTTDLEADIDSEKVVLTWPAVDTQGNLVNFNPLKAEGQQESTGNPTAGWTNPTQGMIIEYTGWLPDGTHNSISNDNKTNHNVLKGVVDTPTDYPISIKDPKTGDVVKEAYVDTTVVASSFATAYQIQYSEDGVNWTEDHIASTFNHGKKLTRKLENGTLSDDKKNTFFLEDQITEALTSTLKADTLYYIKVNAFDASTPSTKANPYKSFETTITTPKAKELTPAFPTVEGSGKYTQGGRGSAEQQADIYVVTNLTDSVSDPQPGSLRYGLERRDRADKNKSYPRIITFAVGGTISVDPNAGKNERRLNITDNTTILGQTAPGEGITIYGASVKFSGKNIIARYLRIKLGEGYDQDAATASGENIVIDHCTFNWGVDECFTAKELINSSIQYNIIANSLSVVNKNGPLNSDVEIVSGESEAKHGMGSIINGYETSFTHNLYANNGTRNPRFEGSFSYNNVKYDNKMEFSNNVIYNWGHNTGYGGERGNGLTNFTNNYHKVGPNTIEKVKGYLFDSDGNTSKYYISGNCLEGNDAVNGDNVSGFKDIESSMVLNTPVELANPYTAESAEAAYNNVIDNVGASYVRDAQDARLIYNLKNGTGTFINSEFEDGGVSSAESVSDKIDSDSDGIPDDVEDTYGLNKNDSSDSTKIIDENSTVLSDFVGYTYIEAYAEELLSNSPDKDNDNGYSPCTVSISDAEGNVIASTQGNPAYATLYTGETYYVNAQTTRGQAENVYLNDKLISSTTDNNENVEIKIDEPGRYNLAAKTGYDFTNRISSIITVTVIDSAAKNKNLEGFTSIDIGDVRVVGTDNYNESENTLIQQGAGHIGKLATIGTQGNDIIHYNYKQLNGDTTLIAQIDNIAKIDYYQQSGLMLRASLDADSEFYMASLSYQKGEDKSGKDIAGQDPKAKYIGTVYRTAAGNSIAYSSSGNKYLGIPTVRQGEEPNHGWAKIEKVGQQVTISASLDGENWYEIGSYTTTIPNTYYIGFATDAAQDTCDFARYNTTKFSNISLENTPVDNSLGDVNCDGIVDANDAALLLQYLLNPNTVITEEGLENAKVTKSDTINSQNVAEILQKALDSSYVMSVNR